MRSRERACTCLHMVWCSQSRSCLLSRQCGTFLFSVRGRCVASRLRKVTASHCLPRAYTVCTPGRKSGRWRTFERRQLRTSLSGLLSLVHARAVLCVKETCRVQTCGLYTKEIAHSSLHGNLLRSCVTFRNNCRRKEKQPPRRARSTRGGSSTSPRRWVEQTRRRRKKTGQRPKYAPSSHHQYHCDDVRRKGYLPNDQSSGRRPSPPATTESPLFTWSDGQKKTVSLGRCPGSLPLFETDPEDENQTTQQGQEHTTGPDPHTEPEKKARGQGRPHRHAPGNGCTDEPENKVAFPTF